MTFQTLINRFLRLEKKVALEDGGGGGGTITIPPTPYASNAEAVAALGTGKLYKSSTLSVNGSPQILITI